MEQRIRNLLSALQALRETKRAYADDPVMSHYIQELAKSVVRVARRFCTLTERKPSEFDARLGMKSFLEE